MKTVRPTSPKQTWQPLRSGQPAPAPKPPSQPVPSNECAAHAVRVASSKGGIDGTMMHPVKKITR
jgi:hypothetical protein